MIKTGDGSLKKIFLASVRSPRLQDTQAAATAAGSEEAAKRPAGRTRSRPLYDVPYMFEAREFLRKKLIGKKVPHKSSFQSKLK